VLKPIGNCQGHKSARKTAGSPLKVSAKTDWKLSGELGWDITSRALDAENRGLYVGWQALVHNLPFMVYGSGTGTQSAVYGLWFRRWYTICRLWLMESAVYGLLFTRL